MVAVSNQLVVLGGDKQASVESMTLFNQKQRKLASQQLQRQSHLSSISPPPQLKTWVPRRKTWQQLSQPPVAASSVEQLCGTHSVFCSILDQNRAPVADIAQAIGIISSNHRLLDQVLRVKAGTEQWAKHEKDFICSNPHHLGFYLAMLDRLRCHVLAGEVIASGDIATSNRWRNDVLKVVQTKTRKKKLQRILETVCRPENLAWVVESATRATPLPGIGVAGSLVARLIQIAGENQFMPFARISYFVALSQVFHQHQGGLEGVLDRTCRCVLWACHNRNDHETVDNKELAWWKRQVYRMTGTRVETQVQEDGFAAAEPAVQCIMHPKQGCTHCLNMTR
ncbi:hypothetical protein ACA910_014167 [Epithemia clementina (nom. ined.)]